VQGGPWYGRQGRRNSSAKGLRFFSICGDVRKPGVHEVPNGTTLGELIELSGGIIDNLPLFAFAPSGPSGGFLPAKLTRQMIAPEYHRAIPADQTDINVLDLPLDLDEFRTLGLMLGAGMMVYADRPGRRPDMLAQALSATRFYRRESCGKCVPCRVGCQKLVEIGERLTASSRTDPYEIQRISDLVQDLSETLELTSICGLGTSAPKPLSSYMTYFLESDNQRNES
jgi:NADH:ubiquinone oxidoreductase subunit F (NADH-binding)